LIPIGAPWGALRCDVACAPYKALRMQRSVQG
jgi:hypothetical protein